jgi:C4-type Zn-finger protein
MACTRCQGLMLEEQMIDMEAGYGEMWSCSWRCVNCGHRDDAVMQHHRQLQAKPMVIPTVVTGQELVEMSWESEEVEPLVA